MLGFSVFLNEHWSQDMEDYIHKMVSSGFEGIFTSLHIPEDDPAKYRVRLKALLCAARERQLKVMIDISGDALKYVGLSLRNPQQIVESGISGLRMDDGIEWKDAALLSNYLTVGLNASTLIENDYIALAHYHANFNNIEVWHNYYPRPDTGLDEIWFRQKNAWLKEKHFRTVAFVPGDGRLRSPLYETLPTLEIHRYQNPLAATLSLLKNNLIDDVYIGDPRISKKTFNQFSDYLHEDIVLLHASLLNKKWCSFVFKSHRNRLDVAKNVIRSDQSRVLNRNKDIQPEHTVLRKKGSITVDNNLYRRYKGELQLTRCQLPFDTKVNVIGQITDHDLALMQFIQAGTKFKITDIQGETQ